MSRIDKYDVIIIGGGHNGLTAAAYLSKAGKKVLVLESRNEIGGLSSRLKFNNGYQCNMIHDNIKWIDLLLVN